MSLSVAPVGRLRTGARASALHLSFVAGSAVTWFGEFRDPVSNSLSSASGVEFQFLAPDGTPLIGMGGALVSTGIYGATIAPADAGEWVVRLFASGARVDERRFVVAESSFPAGAIQAVPVVTPGGAFLVLPNGNAIGGVV